MKFHNKEKELPFFITLEGMIILVLIIVLIGSHLK